MSGPNGQESPAPLLHIGYHKTGSTLLQERLFNRADLGFERLCDDRSTIHRLFIRYRPFQEIDRGSRDAMHEQIKAAARQGRRLVISHERLSGYPASGGFDSRLIADRLHDYFPEAKILIFVREQSSMLASYYLQYITDGGSQSLGRFLSANDPDLFRKPEFDLAFFDYAPLVQFYRNRFGSENVCVIPFEAIQAEPDRVVADIRALAGFGNDDEKPHLYGDIFSRRVNAGNPIVMQWARRIGNGLFGRNQLAPDALFKIPHFSRGFQKLLPLFSPFRLLDGPLKSALSKRINQRIHQNYAAGNAMLQTLTEYQLKQYGYQMPQESKLK